MKDSTDPPAPPTGVVAAPPHEPARYLTVIGDCQDDVALPPGGGVVLPSMTDGAGELRPMPDPAYMDRYGRDLRIDLLRGYFVFAMIVDHVRGASPLYLITGGNRFFTSAAEGFILTSGLVAGLVYRRLIQRDGMAASLYKVLQRARSLYLLTVGLTLLLLPISEVLYLPWAQGVNLSNPVALIVSILTLHRTYYLADVMLLYTVLFLVLPMTFVMLARGMTWPILLGSWALWGLYQVFPEYAALPWPIAGNYLFQFSAWQVLFFSGLVLGYHQDRIPALGCNATRVALLLTGIGTAILIAMYFIFDPPTDIMPGTIAVGSSAFHNLRLWLQADVFAKVDLRFGRIVASATVFTFLFLAATLFWKQAQRLTGWLLLPLGQHALYAYTAHVVVTAVVAALLLPFNLTYPGPQWLNALIQIASVLLIWLLVRWQFLAPRSASVRRLWETAPVAIALGLLILLVLFPPPPHPGLEPPPAQAISIEERVARRFGTPIAKSGPGTGTPSPQQTPTPTPRPESPVLSDALARVAPYLTELDGTLQERWFYSPELDRDMPYWVYTPPDYGTADRRYPVLYMLHGRGGHRDEWIAYGFINTADQQIRIGALAPLIIILPQGDQGFWVNNVDDGPRWGEYIQRDLIAHVDATYRTLRSPNARAIGGLSMGAWGALSHAFRRPDLFNVVGAHSPSLRLEGDETLTFLGTGKDWERQDPISLAATMPWTRALHIWIDAAEADPWLDRTIELHNILAARGIEHTFQIYPGSHDYNYWHEHSVDYLRFYGNSLARR